MKLVLVVISRAADYSQLMRHKCINLLIAINCRYRGTVMKMTPCGYCHYVYGDTDDPLQDVDWFASDSVIFCVYGVKVPSILSLIPSFDIVTGFVPGYMHSALLGIVRQFVFCGAIRLHIVNRII